MSRLDAHVAGPVALALIVLAAGVLGVYRAVVTEDGPLEWAQFAAFAAAAGWFGGGARRRRAEGDPAWPAFALLAIGFVVVAGEEAAWGQRLVDLRVDAVQRANRQDELTLHNLGDNLTLSWFAFALLALFGAAGWRALRLLPRRAARFVAGAVPDRALRWWFLPAVVYAVARIAVLDRPSYAMAKASEYFELAVAIGFACAARASTAVDAAAPRGVPGAGAQPVEPEVALRRRGGPTPPLAAARTARANR